MTPNRNESTWIGRLYAALIEASATAIAVHYDAPWNRPDRERAGRNA